MGKQSLLKWPLICGVSVGVLTGHIYFNILNVCTCCSIVALAGFLASWRSSVDAGQANRPFDVGQGTITGLLSGLIYGPVNAIASVAFMMLFPGPMVRFFEFLRTFLENAEGVPPEIVDSTLDQIDLSIEQLQDGVFSIWDVIQSMVGSLVVGVIFCTIGGLIAGAVFKKTPQAPVALGPIVDPVE